MSHKEIIRDRAHPFSFHDYYDVIGDSKKYSEDAMLVWNELKDKNIIGQNFHHLSLLDGLCRTMISLFTEMAGSYEKCEGSKKEIIDIMYSMFNGMRQSLILGNFKDTYYRDLYKDSKNATWKLPEERWLEEK